jgi:YkoY family integral membrane protein
MVAWYIVVLAFLEGLLSADNALVLALMVRHLPRRDQRRVLIYGIWGAIVFRIVAVLLSTILLKLWQFKVAGGAYLLYLAIAHFLSARKGQASPPAEGSLNQAAGSRRFWGTVTSVTVTDIAFSIDSILAAVAMAVGFPERFGDNGKLFIVITGGVLGIITMRFVVRYFLILLDRFPGLAEGAYALVAWIGLKLLISGIHDAEYIPYHVPEWLFWSGMVLIAVLSVLIRPRAQREGESSMQESLDLLESEEEPDPSGDSESTGEPPSDREGDEPGQFHS